MTWLFILVLFSPVLVFKGLTLETLYGFFNVHPFLFVFMLEAIFTTHHFVHCRGSK